MEETKTAAETGTLQVSEKPEKQNKKRLPWGAFLGIWAGAMLLLGLGLCVFLYRYLAIYEVTRPEATVEELLKNNDADVLIGLAKTDLRLDVTEYENEIELYEDYLKTVDLSKEMSYRSDNKRSTEENPSFVVQCGAGIVFDVTLKVKGESPGFGRNYWEVESIHVSSVTDALPSANVVVDILPGEKAYLNGKEITEAYLADEEVKIPDLSDIESRGAEIPVFEEYRIGPLYRDLKVTDAEGKVLSYTEKDGKYYYQASTGKYRVVIHAPEDLKVCVNGAELTRDDAAGGAKNLVEGLDEFAAGKTYPVLTYELNGLYLPPEVTVANGEKGSILATTGDSFYVFADDGNDEELSMAAKGYFEAYMHYSAYAFQSGNYYALLGKILPGTELYRYVANSRDAMIWASATKTEYKDLRYENIHRISDDCFVCTISYDAEMQASSWYKRYNYELKNAYRVVFVKRGDIWLAAKMDVLGE